MKYPAGRRLRLVSQIFFLALFLFLLLETSFHGSLRSTAAPDRLPYPVGLFLQIDPLVAVANALSTRQLYGGLIWSLFLILPTLFLGRFFCGWICPLGTLNHLFSSLGSGGQPGRRRIESNRYKNWQRLKYYILIVLLASAVFGGQMVGILDPISLTVRSLSLSVLPAVNYAANALLDGLSRSPVRVVHLVGIGLQAVLQNTILSFRQPYFRQGFFLGLLFFTILALNFRITRFWCRALCPLGALLGILSRWSILGLHKHPERCTDCNLCLLHCQGGDDPIPGAAWHKAECHLCLNCTGECPESGLEFRFFRGRDAVKGPNLQRRQVLTGLAGGAALVPLLRSAPGLEMARDDRLIRPPGALPEKDFLERCIRCGECLKVCPNNALQPSLAEAGLEGIWSPVLTPRIGYCETSCVLCSQVCPTGAIWAITPAEKGWSGNQATAAANPIRIGTAFYDRGRCLPWAMATECLVCEEWCPTSPKAIYLVPEEVIDANGNRQPIRRPYVNPDLCVGCGACEYACPVRDRPAIYVTSIGESRSAENQILLKHSPRRPHRETS